MAALKFMFVDDSATIRAFLKRLVKIVGYEEAEITEAENGIEALKLLKKEAVDLVITDLHMPVMTGIQMVKIMAVDPVLKQIPVIIFSSEGSEVRLRELQKAGVRTILRKPATPEVVKQALDAVLEAENG